jgi:hypothetical protein
MVMADTCMAIVDWFSYRGRMTMEGAQLSRVLIDIVGKNNEHAALLDNAELLFDVSLKQDPLQCLQGLSRHRAVVAASNSTI